MDCVGEIRQVVQQKRFLNGDFLLEGVEPTDRLLAEIYKIWAFGKNRMVSLDRLAFKVTITIVVTL
jgi:hypothetical protein